MAAKKTSLFLVFIMIVLAIVMGYHLTVMLDWVRGHYPFVLFITGTVIIITAKILLRKRRLNNGTN